MEGKVLPQIRGSAACCRAGYALLAALGAFLLFLNLLTPMAADDFYYACRLGLAPNGTLTLVRRLHSLADVAASQKCVYIAHSGRLPVLAAAQLFTLLPTVVFDCCNTAAFLLLLCLITLLARPQTPRAAALTVLAAFLLFWQFTPAFGQDFLWQTGALNYLWTLDVNLLFLLPFLRPELLPRLPHAAALYFVLGTLSGWSMENQSAAACFLCVSRLAALHHKRRPLPLRLAAGTAGQLLGFALLMLAPGNYRRSAGYGQGSLPLPLLPARALQYTAALWQHFHWSILFTAAFGGMLLVGFRNQPKKRRPFLWLAAGAAVCHLSMVVSPSYPMRSMLGYEGFLLAAMLYCLNRLPALSQQAARISAILCSALGLCFALSLPGAVNDLTELHSITTCRAAFLAQQKRLGQTDVTLPVARAHTRFNPLWGDALSDLMQDPCNERNRALALYSGVLVVRGDPDMTVENLGTSPPANSLI